MAVNLFMNGFISCALTFSLVTAGWYGLQLIEPQQAKDRFRSNTEHAMTCVKWHSVDEKIQRVIEDPNEVVCLLL